MPAATTFITTSAREQIIDITTQVQSLVAGMLEGEGIVCISVPHCTCAVYVNENETGLVADTLCLIERLTSGRWAHDLIDNNADAHLAATLIGNSVILPFSDGSIELGTWQRVMLVELDGPRQRRVTITAVGDAAIGNT